MARKKLENVVANLSELIESWGRNKVKSDALAKSVKADGDAIKKIMVEKKLTTTAAGGYTANLSFQHKETFDEEGLIHYIKSVLWGKKGSMECPYIERVEIVNWDALEKAMYNGEITKKQMLEIDKFKTVTETPVLRLTVNKKEDGE